MRKKVRFLLLIVLAAIVSLAAVACDKNSDGGNGPKFLDGALTEVTVGQEVRISEFADFGDETDYTFTITDPDGKEKDFSSRVIWIPENVGEHKLTYTVNGGKNKGSAEMTVTVKAYEIEWSYNNAQSLMYQMGSTLEFSDLFEAMNITVQSFCPYRLKMVSVLVDGNTTEFTDETEYTFTSLSDHCFRFKVETDDGQQDVATVIVQIKYMDDDAKIWMSENHISEHGYKRILGDGSVLLDAGTFSGKASSVSTTDLPYIAFNGRYGAGDYVTVDFTGDNLPQVAFFADDVTADLIDGENGIYLANAMGSAMGTEKTRLTVYGPRKIKGGVFGGSDRLLIETDCALGSAKLSASARYRYIAGVKEVSDKTYNAGKADEKTGLGATLKLLLVNLDTGETVYDKELALVNMARYELSADYFTGNIVLYGGFDRQTAWDKVYLIRRVSDNDDIYDWVKTAEFAPYAANTVPASVNLNKSDFISPEDGADYKLWYTDVSGVKTNIAKTETTFSFPAIGEYRLYYDSGESGVMPVSMAVSVTDMSAETWSYLKANGMRLYKATLSSADKSAVLQEGTFTGKAASVGSTDLPYISFDGDYGAKDYVTVDFTGSALPQIAFFVKNTTPDLVDGKAGTYVTNGMEASGNTTSHVYKVYGPTKIKGATFGAWGDHALAGATKPIGASDLSPMKRYRYIAGVEEVSDKTFNSKTGLGATLRLLLIDLDAGEYVLDESVPLNKSAIHSLTADDFKGNIVLYGKLGEAVSWDKVHGVNRNVDNVYDLIDGSRFKAGAKAIVNPNVSLSVGDYIETGESGYALYYENEQGERTDITGTAFSFASVGTYTLYYRSATATVRTSMTVTVTNEVIRDDVTAKYRATLTRDGGAVFEAGSYGGTKDSAMGTADVPYLAFDRIGDNCYNNFVAVDFTGCNMPNFAFFCNAPNENTKNFVGAKAIMVNMGGIMNPDGTTVSQGSTKLRINVYGPTLFTSPKDPATVASSQGFMNQISGTQVKTYDGSAFISHDDLRKQENATNKYRMIAGCFKSENAQQVRIGVAFMQKNADQSAEKEYTLIWSFVGNVNANCDAYDQVKDGGSIILYGRPYEAVTIDKVHGIYGNTESRINTMVNEWTGKTLW